MGSDHLIYAFMMGSGTYIPTAGGGADFTFTSGGSLNLWLDYDGSSIASFLAPTTGNLPWTTASLDTLIATGAVTGGTGTLTPLLSSCGPHPLNPTGSGINCGSFGTTTSFVLTAAGSDYFIAPVPFYEVSFQSGQLNNFEVAGTQTINGSLDVVFNRVPEPSSIALVGLGLIGLAAGLRRRKQA